MSADTFQGLAVKARVPIHPPRSPAYQQLTLAITQWRRAAGNDRNPDTCNNAALELEIERDHGVIIHLNRRTA